MLIITVVICTYNRKYLLAECLQSFLPKNQMVDPTCYEVLVINNNSSDDTQKIANIFSQKYKNFRVCLESEQGLSFARNRGYKEAKGEWIAYVDDDAKAHNNYISRLLFNINNYQFDCIGGSCIPKYHKVKPIWYRDNYQIPAKNLFGALAIGYIDGFNCVFKKNILIDINGFNVLIGMNGNKIAYGEETEVQVKIRKNGGIIFFDPDLIVDHYIDDYKLTVIWFLKSSYANGRDSWFTFHQKPSLYSLAKLFFSIHYRLLKNTFMKSRLLLKKDYYCQNLVIDVIVPVMNLIGRFSSGVYILVSRG